MDYVFYLFWAAIVAFGALLAVIDRRWVRWPVLGLGLVAGVLGGLVVTQVSPFNFADGGYYMEGVILSAASALALVGYVLAALWFLARRVFKRRLS